MDYEQAMEAVEKDGFRWYLLREYFPFGAVELREGNYQRLVIACLDSLSSQVDRERLLDLLDMQAVTFLEQCWVQNEMEAASAAESSSATADELGTFGMAAHFAAAWIQINSNLRGSAGLDRTDLMRVLRGLPAGGSLAQYLSERRSIRNGVE